MIYLLDTNIWLELLLEQENATQVREFLATVEGQELVISEFSLYSIGVILTRRNKDDALRDFISDTIHDSGVGRARLEPSDFARLLEARTQFKLDFDDAYQYVAAEKNNLEIISFDHHFDQTPRGRKTPGQVLASIQKD